MNDIADDIAPQSATVPAARPAATRHEHAARAADRLQAIGLMCLAVTSSPASTPRPSISSRTSYSGRADRLGALPRSVPRHAVVLRSVPPRLCLRTQQAQAGALPLAADGVDDGVQFPGACATCVSIRRHDRIPRAADRGAARGPLLGEWVGWRRLVAISSASSASSSSCGPASAACTRPSSRFGGMLAYAFFMLLTRYLAAFDRRSSRCSIRCCSAPRAGAVRAWHWVTPERVAGCCWGLGVLGGTGHYLFVQAYRLAPASAVAPFLYLQLMTMFASATPFSETCPTCGRSPARCIIVGSGV